MPYKDPEKQRAAQRRHYQRNKVAMKARAGQFRDAQRRRLAAYIREQKKHPCMDCGQSFPYYVMDFDHVTGDKEDLVSHMAGRAVSLDTLKAEIAKCQLVCANCHRQRTFMRGQALVG